VARKIKSASEIARFEASQIIELLFQQNWSNQQLRERDEQ